MTTQTTSDWPYHVEVHTRRAGHHLTDVCDDYRTLAEALRAAVWMSETFAGDDEYYCQVTSAATGDIVADKSCHEWWTE